MIENRLLLVDDNEDSCSSLSDVLTDLGYAVDVAYRGWDGLDLLKQYPYRLVLLDYKLPCMTGVELFQRMRLIHNDVEGLLVTGYATDETAADAASAGMLHVIDKPVDMSRLLPFVKDALVI